MDLTDRYTENTCSALHQIKTSQSIYHSISGPEEESLKVNVCTEGGEPEWTS